MAEVIGILSGAITFIDAGIKVANLLSSLKNAPKRIAAYHEELQHTVQLVNTIKNDLDRLSNGTGSIPPSLMSQPDLDELRRYIQEVAEVTKEVEAFLDVATASPQAGRMEKSWKAVRARKLQGEVTERLERIGGLKVSIQFWFNRQTYLISAGQVGSNVYIGRSIQALQDRLDSVESALRTATSSAESSISAAVQRSQHAVVAVVRDEIQMLRQPTGGSQSAHASAMHQQALSKTSFLAAKCTCKRSPSPYISLGPIYFRDDKRHIHEKRCPLRHSSNRRMLFGLRASLFHLQFVGSFGARGFAFAPQVKLPGRVVDVTQSSTFVFMTSTLDRRRSSIGYSNLVQILKNTCSELATGLSMRFANLDGFANDQDQDGTTLLHGFVEFMIMLRGLGSDLADAFDAVDSVVSLLTSYGADPNATVSCDRNEYWYDLGGTPMDRAIRNRKFIDECTYTMADGPFANTLLEAVLRKHGCELSGFTDPGAADIGTILLCMHDPEFAIDLGFPDYYLPIFRKSFSQLREITTRGQDWNDYDERFASPVECCLLWTDGLEYLLDWGVDSRPALPMALKANLTSAIRLLVTYDCPAFFVKPWRTEIEYTMSLSNPNREYETSLLNPKYYRDATFRIAVLHVTRTRRLLAEYGLKNLPESWERHHLQHITSRGILLDQYAIDIWNALETGNHHPPAFLWPGTAASVYHTVVSGYSDYAVVRITKCLWEAGFRDVFVADLEGWTPIDLAFSEANFDTCSFLLSKGAQLPPDALWMSIKRLLRKSYITPPWLMKQFPQLESDGCTCFCSVSGCTPASIFSRTYDLGYFARRKMVDLFSRTLPAGSREKCHMAHMRVEVFERLGMGHTCCRQSFSNYRMKRARHEPIWETPPIDEIEEIQAEDHALAQILEDCIKLFENVRQGFRGRFRVSLKALRASMDLLLPFEDSVGNNGLSDVQRESSMGEDAPSNQLSTWIDVNTVCAIVRHYQGVSAHLGSHIETNIQTGLDKAVFDYAPEVQKAIENGEKIINYSWSSVDAAYDGYQDMYARDAFGEPMTFESRKKELMTHFIHDNAVPVYVARVIRDLSIDRVDRIPQEILDILEREGIVRGGKLTSHESIEREDIFAEGIDMLAL